MVAVTGRATTRAERDATPGDDQQTSGQASGPPGPGDPTGAVGRYVRRPLWWLPAALFLGALLYGTEIEQVWADEETFGRGEPLPARVAGDYDGGDEILVTYDHPLFGTFGRDFMAAVSLPSGDTGPRPEPGDLVRIRAARDDPLDVRLLRDDPDRPGLWMALPFVVPLLAASGRRAWTARRARRVLDRDPQAMWGRVRPRRRRDQTVALDLFPEDGDPGGRPVCSVPLVTSLGLPVGGGPVFPVEVHGRARPFGRVVARVGDGVDDEVLWPRRRALLLPRWLSGPRSALGGQPTRGEEVDEAPRLLELRRLRDPKQVWPSPSGRRWGAGMLLAGGLVVGTLGTLTVLQEADRARSLPEGSVEAPARVVGIREDGLIEVAVRLPGRSDEERRAAVALPNTSLLLQNPLLLVVVDPDAPGIAQLVPARYRTAEPVIWTWLPAVVAAVWLGRTWTWARTADRAAGQSRWWAVEVSALDRTTLQVCRPGAGTASCLVTLPQSTVPPPAAIERTLRRGGATYAASPPAPGEKVVLRFAGVVVPTTSAATVRDRPWRRRWRALSGWLQRQPSLPRRTGGGA